MKFRKLKKILKNSELNAIFEPDFSVSYFVPWNKKKGYFMNTSLDWDGEPFDCYVSVKDLKQLVKKYKFAGFLE